MLKLIVAVLLPASLLCAEVLDPRKPGPFPVGVTTSVFVDASRTDNVTQKPRTLVTEIWYPATDDARSLPKNRYRDFIPGGVSPALAQLLAAAYRRPVDQIEEMYWNSAVRDARVRSGRYPLVIFSHGNGGSRFQNTFWFDHLASHGYIVVSADHTGNARLTVLDGELIPYRGNERLNSAQDRPKDAIFLLEQMIRWSRGADSRFAGRIDTDAVAMSGMSFGSMTAINAANADPRFKAVVGMALGSPVHTNKKVPLLVMLGEHDRTIGAAGNARIRQIHADHCGPAFLLELKYGGHFSFTDMFKINKLFGDGVGRGKAQGSEETVEFTPMERTYEVVNAYSTAFLGVYLRGEKQYLPFLEKNQWPDTIEWKPRLNESGCAVQQ